MTIIRLSWVSNFQIMENEISDKERSHWGPEISVNSRSVDESVLVRSSLSDLENLLGRYS
jgi:hypothetical protein